MENPAFYFVVAMTACFLGSVPVGPINLVVVKTTVDYSPRAGLEVAVAASVVEILQAAVAIFFGMFISDLLQSNLYIKLGIAAAFILLAVVLFLRKTNPQFQEEGDEERRRSFFRRGLLVAVLNPQAVPFWIFALAAISQYVSLAYTGYYLAFFLAGVMAGKLAALYGFVVASGYIREHLRDSCRLVNKVLAGVLLLIGLSQLWNAFV